MTASAFTPLPQDVADPDELWRAVSQFIFAANGSTSWQRLWTLTGVTDAANYVMTIQNSGTGGLGLLVKASNGTTRLAVADAGVTIGGGIALSGNLTFVPDATYDIGAGSLRPRDVFLSRDLAVGRNETVAGTLGVTLGTTLSSTLHGVGAVTFDSTLDVTGAITGAAAVQGTRLVSTVATGTAPLTVASTTLVANLNAALLGGSSLATLVSQFVDAAGDTMSGVLTMQPVNDQAIKLTHTSGDGGFWIGATHAANPVMVFKDNGGTQTFEVGNSASTYQARVLGTLLATGAVTFNSNVTLGDAAIDAITVTGTALFSQTPVFSANIDVQSGVAGQIRAGVVIVNAASQSGTEKLRVNGTSLFEGDITLSASPWTDFSSVITLTQNTTRTRTVTQAKYRVFGKTALVQFQVTCTDAGSAGSQIIIGGIPSAIAPANTGNRAVAGTFQVYDASATTYYSGPAAFVSSTQLAAFQDGSTTGLAIGGTPSFALANGDIISCQLAYELA